MHSLAYSIRLLTAWTCTVCFHAWNQPCAAEPPATYYSNICVAIICCWWFSCMAHTESNRMVCVYVCVWLLSISEPPSIVRNAPPPTPPVYLEAGKLRMWVNYTERKSPSNRERMHFCFFAFTGMGATPSFYRFEGDMFVEI